MKPLSALDQLFLWLEANHRPMHVGGLTLFSFPEDAGDDHMARVMEQLRAHEQVNAPFNQRLTKQLGQWGWVTDEALDMGHHLRLEALPGPGRIRELLSFVSNEHSHLMDRDRPLWEFHVIEGLQDRRFAFYVKFHHAFVDGISAMRVFDRMVCEDPDERDMLPFWALPRRSRGGDDLDGSISQTLQYLLRSSGRQIATLPGVARELFHLVQRTRDEADGLGLPSAPPAILNQRITNARRFAAQSWSLSRFREIGHAFGATVNDVVLAICGHALRRYLQQRNELPQRSLIAMVPISLHDQQNEQDDGNRVGTLLTPLATDTEDPLERLARIRESTQHGKARYACMSAEEILNYNALMLAPTCFNLLTGMAPSWQAFNVIISNVPGPRKPVYWNGARMEGMYPVSIPFDRLALNITLTSYCDEIEFGLIGCRRTLPSLQKLLGFLEEGLESLEQHCDRD